MEVIIITGQSGAGKTTAIDALEDRGVFCVDNVPPKLIPSFVEMAAGSTKIEHLAICTDVRAGEMLHGLKDCIKQLEDMGQEFKILYLQCASDVLEKRYRATRRIHPLQKETGINIADAINSEVVLLRHAFLLADYHIDTTFLSVAQLKENVNALFDDLGSDSMTVKVMSFGFKNGVPTEANLVFDVRCLPNPFYVEELKPLSGKDAKIQNWLAGFEETDEFERHIKEFISMSLPLYKKEGKSQLVIGIGCTGGRHRSVCIAEHLYRFISDLGYDCDVYHRDMEREK